MPRYHSSIHSPIFPSQLSSYSALSGALAPPPSQFTSSRRRRVPQSTCKTSNGPICGPIGFDYIGQAGQGVSLADFSARSQNAINQMVTGANDQVLSGTAISKINLRIMVSISIFSSELVQIRTDLFVIPFFLPYSGQDTNIWILFKVCLLVRICQKVNLVQVSLCNSGHL
jgi:hypothetical protein